jgi:cellulase/cellobiase CelA1
VQSQWGQGYVAQVQVSPSGGAIQGWTVTLTLHSGHQVSNHWNAEVATTGQVLTAQNLSYNGNLAPGQSAEWGFQAGRSDTALPSQATCTAVG